MGAKSRPVKRQLMVAGGIVAALLVVVGIIAGVEYYHNHHLTAAQKKFLAQAEVAANAQPTNQNLPVNTGVELDTSIKEGHYSDAEQKINKLLVQGGLTTADTQLLYTALRQTCLPLQDLSCFDKVIAYQKSQNAVDIFFVVDAAHTATGLNQPDKAKAYYKQALDIIDAQGGQAYVDKLNNSLQVTLDYNAIKAGAGE